MKTDICIVVNGGSGKGNDEAGIERIRALFAAAEAKVEILVAHGGEEIKTQLEAALALEPRILVGGGGDGTLSAVAAALVGTDIALGVLPLGTLNHFAKDLGIPLELEAAVKQILSGHPVRVDTAEVNGRVFINNSSLGLYPDIVRDRERQQKRLGRGKWPALTWATLGALRRFPFLTVQLDVDGTERVWKTPLVFIGNNAYEMAGFAIGERTALNRGHLSLYVTQRAGRFRLLLLALRALFGRLRQARDFEATLAAEIVVASRHRRLRVATDGEVNEMTPPLRYRIRPASLLVMLAAAVPTAT